MFLVVFSTSAVALDKMMFCLFALAFESTVGYQSDLQ